MVTDFFVLFQQTLLDIDDLHSFVDLNTFSQNIPVEWVESALDLSSKATTRRRRLPSEQLLWLVIGMAWFRNEPVNEAAHRLNICANGLANENLLARSGLSEARQRLDEEPLNGSLKERDVTGVESDTHKMISMVCKCLRLRERYSEQLIRQSYANTLALEIHRTNAKHLFL